MEGIKEAKALLDSLAQTMKLNRLLVFFLIYLLHWQTLDNTEKYKMHQKNIKCIYLPLLQMLPVR